MANSLLKAMAPIFVLSVLLAICLMGTTHLTNAQASDYITPTLPFNAVQMSQDVADLKDLVASLKLQITQTKSDLEGHLVFLFVAVTHFTYFLFLIFLGLKKQTVTSIQEQIYDLVAIVSEHQLCLGGNRSCHISFLN